jgi:cytochrome c-type biogenesis protein CcmH
MSMVLRYVVAMLWLLAVPAFAVQPDEVLSNANLEKRARIISQDLRCLVCQNQSIDDSDATVAKELRLFVRERLVAGDSDAQVMEQVTSRYGNFVRLEPPFNPTTYLLWLLPFATLILGGLIALRSRSSTAVEVPPHLDEADQARVAAYLEEK